MHANTFLTRNLVRPNIYEEFYRSLENNFYIKIFSTLRYLVPNFTLKKYVSISEYYLKDDKIIQHL